MGTCYLSVDLLVHQYVDDTHRLC